MRLIDIGHTTMTKSEILELWDDKNPRNWCEDFSHENGKYFNTCCICKKDFLGHKRRVSCKECSKPKSVMLRCHTCKSDYTFPAEASPLHKFYCEQCKEWHMKIFWIE